jgi:hypothetical protein
LHKKVQLPERGSTLEAREKDQKARMLAVQALVSEMGLKCSALNIRQTAIHSATESEER